MTTEHGKPCHACGAPTHKRTGFLGHREERCTKCPAFTYWDDSGFEWRVAARFVSLMRGDEQPQAERGTVDVGGIAWTAPTDPRKPKTWRTEGTDGNGNVHIYDENDDQVATVFAWRTADTYLICAAPALLAALTELRRVHGNCGSTVEQQAADAADAAISKAGGL